MNKITDLIISAILKRGIMHESHNVEAEVDIPDTNMKIKIKIEHMTLKFEKNGKED